MPAIATGTGTRDMGGCKFSKAISLREQYKLISALGVQNQFLIKRYNAQQHNLIAQRGAPDLSDRRLLEISCRLFGLRMQMY